MGHLAGTPHNAQIILVVVILVFVVIPLCFKLSLKLLEPDLNGVTPLGRRARRHRVRSSRESTGEWGPADAAYEMRTQLGDVTPHEGESITMGRKGDGPHILWP